jgi:ribosome biogenesis GTPase
MGIERGTASGHGTVYASGGGVYRVRLDDGSEVEAAMRGRLKLQKRTGEKVVIGDRVRMARVAGDWVIDAVDERRTQMVRRSPGGRKGKVVAANLDRIIVVVAARDPSATFELIDRLLAVVEASGLHPVLVVNKVDLPGGRERFDEIDRTYGPIGYRVLAVSAVGGEGMEAFAREACAGTAALVGPSGVGKSSLLNRLDPALELRTGELSTRGGRGRHTTVESRLIPLACGGVLADTPGFGDVGLWRVDPDDVEACFPELAERAEGCRFRRCTHTSEPDCAVRAAVERGEVAGSRYRSYVGLREEAKHR